MGGKDSALTKCANGNVRQVHISCDGLMYAGKPGLLRIKKKRGKWRADITFALQEAQPTEETGVMGVDMGIKVPAVTYVVSKGMRFSNNGSFNGIERKCLTERCQEIARRQARATFELRDHRPGSPNPVGQLLQAKTSILLPQLVRSSPPLIRLTVIHLPPLINSVVVRMYEPCYCSFQIGSNLFV